MTPLDRASDYLTLALRSIRSIKNADDFSLARMRWMDSSDYARQPMAVQIEIRDALEAKRQQIVSAAVTP